MGDLEREEPEAAEEEVEDLDLEPSEAEAVKGGTTSPRDAATGVATGQR